MKIVSLALSLVLMANVAVGQYTASYSNLVTDITISVKNGANAWKATGGVCENASLAVSQEGNTWCVGTDHRVYKSLPKADSTWYPHPEMGTSVVALAVLNDSTIYSLQPSSDCTAYAPDLGIFSWNGTTWVEPHPGSCASQISVGIDGFMTAVTRYSTDPNYLWSSTNGGASWQQWATGWSFASMWASAIGCGISGNTAYEISAGNPATSIGSPSLHQLVGCLVFPLDNGGNLAWDNSGAVFYEDDGAWYQLAGSMEQVAGASKGSISALDLSGHTYKLNMYIGTVTQTITGSYANWSGMNPATRPTHYVTSNMQSSHPFNPNSSHTQIGPYNAQFNVSSTNGSYFCNPFDESHDPECTPTDQGSETCSQGGFISDPQPTMPGRLISHFYIARNYAYKAWQEQPVYHTADQHWYITVHIPVSSNCASGTATCVLKDVIVNNYVWDFIEQVRAKNLPVAEGVAAVLPSTGPWVYISAYVKIGNAAGACAKIEARQSEADVCD